MSIERRFSRRRFVAGVGAAAWGASSLACPQLVFAQTK
jgi:hypothetical protein